MSFWKTLFGGGAGVNAADRKEVSQLMDMLRRNRNLDHFAKQLEIAGYGFVSEQSAAGLLMRLYFSPNGRTVVVSQDASGSNPDVYNLNYNNEVYLVEGGVIQNI